MIIIKKYYSYIILSIFCLLSFYITNKIALYVKDKNPLMIEIKSKYNELYKEPINSTIIDNKYIIPGLKGQELNINLTFFNMQKNNSLDDTKYVFNYLKPSISIEDNKDKIIIRGNELSNEVSLIFESINDKTKYLKQNNYTIDVLVSKEEYDLYYELINSSNKEETYRNIDNFLNKHRINQYICFMKNNKVPELCEDKFIVKPSLVISHSNIAAVKNNINSGEIIYIKDSTTLIDLTIILNEIKYHDLKIVPLSILIKE